MNNPYTYFDSSSNMIPSFVCFADILGYTQLSNEAIKVNQGEEFLSKLRKALSEAYVRVRKNANNWSGNPDNFSIKIFTDNIVVGYPLLNSKENYGQSELFDIFRTFSEFQIGLALEGFLIRGGIAFGNHYMDNEIVFGDALIEAVAQDKEGGPPCISLAPSAVKMLQCHYGFHDESCRALLHLHLLADSDGTVFLNYLDEIFVPYPDQGIFFDLIEGHKNTIVEGLRRYKDNPGVRSKYEWTASYHNFICQEFAENYRSIKNTKNEILAAVYRNAQLMLNCRIDIESLAAMPSRIKLANKR